MTMLVRLDAAYPERVGDLVFSAVWYFIVEWTQLMLAVPLGIFRQNIQGVPKNFGEWIVGVIAHSKHQEDCRSKIVEAGG